MENKTSITSRNPLVDLKNWTDARIAQTNSGSRISTKEELGFRLDHALARDSVQTELDFQKLVSELDNLNLEHLMIKTKANSKSIYLKRPDLGRTLDDISKEVLSKEAKNSDLAIIIGDGLSAKAIQTQCIPYLKELIPILDQNWKLSKLFLVHYARVAVGDEIGEILQTKLSLMLIGERPGLSSPDSMGAYITYLPKTGRKDSERNCISNIREKGLIFKEAAIKTKYLLEKANRLELTGTELKDEMIEGQGLVDS
ncbi:MAG: ethanolamine ammonia-lyase subunit EutC [Leptospiraceae bacterium]|nr:ethanolamine ammonia-lyase subunit EutC [Leptospiraceae bacterium]